MLPLKAIENLFKRNIRPRVIQGFLDLATNDFIKRLVFAIEGSQAGSHYLAGGTVRPRFDARVDPFLQLSKGHCNGPRRPHGKPPNTQV